MMTESKTYNGWSNYETWAVHLWMSNEEGIYRYWRDEARRCRAEAKKCPKVAEGLWAVDVAEREELASLMRDDVEQASPLVEASLFSDLLNAALSEVDWREIAEAFLEELGPEEIPGPDQAEQDEEEEEDAEPGEYEEFKSVKRDRIENLKGPLFELGRVVSTPGALEALTREDIDAALARHHRGDWGDISLSDWRVNEEALSVGLRLLSIYTAKGGKRFWIITEADRSSTCVLLPSEY